MDVVQAVKSYISRMISESGTGMKVLLMDKETMKIVSMVYAQSEILLKEVFLFELLSNPGREMMKHLTAICFIRPTPDNLDLLCQELRSPKYSSYFVYYSNRTNRQDVERLAQSDDHESVRELKEYYADYLAVTHHLYSFNIDHFTTGGPEYSRIVDGILGLCLSLKKKPMIRYTAASHFTQRLAEDAYRSMNHRREKELFSFRSDIPTLLLVLDRRDDPITPLMNQWTYQAMVHELLGINNHRVDLSSAPGINKELHEIALSPEHDDFFRENMYMTFGDIGANIKTLVDEFQEKQKSHAKIESIADMKAFVENYPQFRKLSGAVSKHVAVVSEMSRLVQEHDLMSVSEVEQDVATQSDKNNQLKNIESLIQSRKVRDDDCVKLVTLFALRYESQKADIERLLRLLERRNISDQKRRVINGVLSHCGQAKRTEGLFESNNPLSMTKKFLRGIKGVENVYTRHKPILSEILESLAKGKLRENLYPYSGQSSPERPQDIIIFFVGGATYAEAFTVAQFNNANQGMRVILGGNTVVNSQGFLDEISRSSPAYTAKERLHNPPV